MKQNDHRHRRHNRCHPLSAQESCGTWVDTQPSRLAVVSITWLEVMEGTSSKTNQTYSKSILSKFDLLYLTLADQQWAIEQLEHFQFSHHIGMNDCLIASVAYRLQVPLYTHT